MHPASIEHYTDRLARPRASIETHSGVHQLLDRAAAPRLLHRFLIEYCARGVKLTAPVDGWIRRAGARCQEIGLAQLGLTLIKHAEHEAGHDALFVNDARALAARYAERYGQTVDVERIFGEPPMSAMQRYIDLHEQTIASDSPFAQVAIELEIEGLSVSLGPALLDNLGAVLGRELLACLTFLEEHVRIDVGHTALNQKMLERLLVQRPESFEVLVQTGSEALSAYADFMGECLERAREALRVEAQA